MNFLKRSQVWISTMAVMVLLLAGCAAGDQPVVVVNPETTGGDTQASTPMTETTGSNVTTGTADTTGTANSSNLLVTATSLTDYNFENIDGNVSGSIQDLILDLNSGNVLYVTVEYGGFLDIGDTELPMPLDAFVWGDNGQLVLNFDEAALNDFPDLGTNWPDTSVAGWNDQVANFWNGIGLGNSAISPGANDTVVRAAQLLNSGLNDIGFGVNTVDDMLIDWNTSQVQYVLVQDENGVTTDQLIAIPFDALTVDTTTNLLIFRDNVNSDVIANAPRVARGSLMPGNTQAYNDVNNYWGGLGYGNTVGANNGQVVQNNTQDNTVTSEQQGLTVGNAVGIAGTDGNLVRASTLLDYNTINANGESMGEIEDLLLDVDTGNILFATIEYGGFLDIGDREVPIPLSAFTWAGNNELQFNLDEQQLESLPDVGTNWPNVTDPTWNDNIVNFWNNLGVDTTYAASDAQSVMYASNLIGTDLGDNGYGADGSVDDLLIDMSQSQATWLVVDYGNLFDNNLVPIPFSAIDVSTTDNVFRFTPNVDATTFENAPRIDRTGFDQNNGLFDSTFDDDIATYWQDAGYTTDTNGTMNR